jgi:hypothetical protein
MEDAGDAGDQAPRTFRFRSDNRDGTLLRGGKSLSVQDYGKSFAVCVDGVDICSADFAGELGPLVPVAVDLSDWPAVPPGRLAVDAKNGRF